MFSLRRRTAAAPPLRPSASSAVNLPAGSLQPDYGGGILAHDCSLSELQGRVNADPVVALTISTFLEDYVWTGPALAGLALILGGNVLAVARPMHAGAGTRPVNPG